MAISHCGRIFYPDRNLISRNAARGSSAGAVIGQEFGSGNQVRSGRINKKNQKIGRDLGGIWMELPRPRPYGTEGRNSSHDFLSLYPHSSSQPHPLASSSQAAYLKTQNFLQPLEQLGKACAKEEIAAPAQISGTGKSTSEKRLLPGGIGTYSIRHVSNFIPAVPKAEGSIFRVAQTSNAEKNEDDLNCTSFLGGGFSLWEESAGKMGRTGKENAGDSQWLGELTARIPSVSMERPSQSSSNNHHNNFSSLSSSQLTPQKNQSFMEIIKSAKDSPRDREIDDDDDDEEFVIKKETSPTIAGELRIKVDRKSSDQKANTPRSKHSATEQRRRSKINDRFQKLRELIPHSDQKRDKASFLLEVVEYIQILQQKVDKYESSYQGLNHESDRLSPWNNNQRTTNPTRVIHAGSYPAVVFVGKFPEKHVSGTSQNPVDSDTTAAPTVKVGNLLPPTTNEELTIEADTNSISSVYSQGLLNSLTRALQSSGVDLSKTSLSVQIELGTKTNSSAFSSDSTVKDVEIPSTNVGSTRFRVAAAGD